MRKDCLDRIGTFSDSDFEIFLSYLLPKQFAKNALLLDIGQTSQSVYFILTGAAYQFRYDDINEKVTELYTENDWCFSYSSFISQAPSQTVIKASSDISAFELSIHTLHHLIGLSPVFFQLGKILEGALARTHYFDGSLTPSQKYHHLIESRPQVLQMFPLKLIASYLNVTPETLSRVRGAF